MEINLCHYSPGEGYSHAASRCLRPPHQRLSLSPPSAPTSGKRGSGGGLSQQDKDAVLILCTGKRTSAAKELLLLGQKEGMQEGPRYLWRDILMGCFHKIIGTRRANQRPTPCISSSPRHPETGFRPETGRQKLGGSKAARRSKSPDARKTLWSGQCSLEEDLFRVIEAPTSRRLGRPAAEPRRNFNRKRMEGIIPEEREFRLPRGGGKINTMRDENCSDSRTLALQQLRPGAIKFETCPSEFTLSESTVMAAPTAP